MELKITIPDNNNYYSLYADGVCEKREYIKESGITRFTYREGAAIFLYYTYPAHREVCLIRNVSVPLSGTLIFLPSLSNKVEQLFSLSASGVDKTKRAAGFLHKHYGSAHDWSDDFYIRLYFLLRKGGKINYFALEKLADLFR
ncbi:MAG: hypothetical protein LBV68_01815 [Spirochaetaceae bacterium]|jgi:hypothetical protein|nr:hypothetical protein [Spirochaetaceae bacterium]